MHGAGAQVEFSQLYYVVGEEEGWVEVDVTASGPSDTSYMVQVVTKSGSAKSKNTHTHTHIQQTNWQLKEQPLCQPLTVY